MACHLSKADQLAAVKDFIRTVNEQLDLMRQAGHKVTLWCLIYDQIIQLEQEAIADQLQEQAHGNNNR